MDLLTGDIYELGDIITIDEEFVKLWCDAAREKYDFAEQTGQILECENLYTNLWLDDDASVWDYWE